MMSAKSSSMNKFGLLVLPVALCLSLGGCTAAAFLQSAGNSIFLRQDVNLTEKNYAAADYLAGLTRQNVNISTPIYVGRLNHANQVGITSAFAAVVPEQVGARFAQLGYNIQMPDQGIYGYNAELGNSRGVILTGTYLPNNTHADVSLRLIDNRNGRILGAFDYSIPINIEIAGLLEERPTTIRMAPTAPGAPAPQAPMDNTYGYGGVQTAPAQPADARQEDLPMRLLGPAPK